MSLDKDTVTALIGLGTLIVTVLSLVITISHDSRKEKSRAKAEIQKAINELVYISTEDEFSTALNNLKKSMISNAHLIKNKKLSKFYDNWLSNPEIQEEKPISDLYSSFETDLLMFELLEVKL